MCRVVCIRIEDDSRRRGVDGAARECAVHAATVVTTAFYPHHRASNLDRGLSRLDSAVFPSFSSPSRPAPIRAARRPVSLPGDG